MIDERGPQMVTQQISKDAHRLTAQQLDTCKRIFGEYQKQTNREPDAWRRLGQAFAEMGRAVYLPPEKLAQRALVPPTATRNMDDWHRTDRQPGLSSIYRIGAYFGVSEGDISDFIHQPLPVPRRGAAGPMCRLLVRLAGATLLGVGHGLHMVSHKTVEARLGPLALDALSLSVWYSGQPGVNLNVSPGKADN
jgi:hypothetical protein